MNRAVANRRRAERALVSLCLTLVLIGFSRAPAHAQTRLAVPLSGSTIKITKAGSYFLDANINTKLIVLPVILVTVSNVTINLNGFSIIGPGGTAGTATGISANLGVSNVTIVNGTITRMHGTGIVLRSNSAVSGVELINNAVDGLDCISSSPSPSACLVTSNIVSGNVGTGLNFGDATSGYQNNIISGNGATVVGGTNMGQNVCNGSLTCP
jgi:hypothetical protein